MVGHCQYNCQMCNACKVVALKVNIYKALRYVRNLLARTLLQEKVEQRQTRTQEIVRATACTVYYILWTPAAWERDAIKKSNYIFYWHKYNRDLEEGLGFCSGFSL